MTDRHPELLAHRLHHLARRQQITPDHAPQTILGHQLVDLDERVERGLWRHVADVEQRLADDLLERLEQLYCAQVNVEGGVEALTEGHVRVVDDLNTGVALGWTDQVENALDAKVLETL